MPDGGMRAAARGGKYAAPALSTAEDLAVAAFALVLLVEAPAVS
jgi:hypothetical protein